MKYEIKVKPVGSYNLDSEKLNYQLNLVSLKQCRWLIKKIIELINNEDFKSYEKIANRKKNNDC